MKTLKQYLIITVGIIIVAISLQFFFFPNGIACGGVSGLALVINKVAGISPGVIMNISNALLFILAFWLIGGNFGVKSMYASFGLSILLSIVERSVEIKPLTSDLMLASIFGSVLLALGSAVILTQNATTGGTSITAKLLNKYANIDFGKGLLISDSIVIIMAIFAFGVELGLYGLLSVYLTGTLIDKFINGLNVSREVMVFTKEEEKVSKYIINEINRGCTILHAKGGYTNNETSVILTILRRNQFIKLKQFIKENNCDAFITVNEINEVLGEGFKNLSE